jgi:hypothetical protein
MGTDRDETHRVDDLAGVGIGRVDHAGWVVDFAGVRVGRVTEGVAVEDFAGVHIGTVADRRPRHAATA